MLQVERQEGKQRCCRSKNDPWPVELLEKARFGPCAQKLIAEDQKESQDHQSEGEPPGTLMPIFTNEALMLN